MDVKRIDSQAVAGGAGTNLRTSAWLLQGRMNPYPIAGELELDDDVLRFTVTKDARHQALRWLEKELDTDSIAQRVENGERIVAFELPRRDLSVKWLRQYYGVGMRARSGDSRKWLVTLIHPGGDPITLFNAIVGSYRHIAKPWTEALARS